MLYDAESGDLNLAVTGDWLLSRSLRVYREKAFLGLRDLLNEVDATFGNLETSVHTYGEGVPTLSSGTYMTTEPHLMEEMKWFGVDFMSAANNHCYDWGEEGVLANIRYLDQGGIAHAGTGRNLREAAAPAYFDSPRGRIALVAATSMFHEWFRATNQRVDCQGKPGVNCLGFESIYTVDREAFDALRRVGANLAFDAARTRQVAFGFRSPSEMGTVTETQYQFLGRKFVLGDRFAINTEVNQGDQERLLQQVREARRQADWVVVSLHNHELGGKTIFTATTRTGMEEPPEFMINFAHRCIDEGADVIAGHGPHIPLGIEVYNGKPIFYSLGNFVMQNETVKVFPSHAYDRFNMDPLSTPADFLDARSDSNRAAHPADPLFWQTVAAVVKFKGKQLETIELHPVDIGFGRPRSQRGRPALADAVVGREILERLARLCRDRGTDVKMTNGIGVISADSLAHV